MIWRAWKSYMFTFIFFFFIFLRFKNISCNSCIIKLSEKPELKLFYVFIKHFHLSLSFFFFILILLRWCRWRVVVVVIIIIVEHFQTNPNVDCMPWLMYNMTYIGLYWFICMLVAVFFLLFIPKLFLKYIFLKMVKKNASKWTNLIKFFSFYFWEKCKRRWYLCILCVFFLVHSYFHSFASLMHYIHLYFTFDSIFVVESPIFVLSCLLENAILFI